MFLAQNPNVRVIQTNPPQCLSEIPGGLMDSAGKHRLDTQITHNKMKLR